ncbi:fibroblast growth factor receptor substrate 2, isoform CRA_a [Mus musculus]|nr:fibroblast growth factor receptor substrate 2, isoform CRA_a [Mus musculus]EDL21827.1 fibroblast growth factor receptor substrate 2, isoform CRA_a [Mus musculus]
MINLLMQHQRLTILMARSRQCTAVRTKTSAWHLRMSTCEWAPQQQAHVREDSGHRTPHCRTVRTTTASVHQLEFLTRAELLLSC